MILRPRDEVAEAFSKLRVAYCMGGGSSSSPANILTASRQPSSNRAYHHHQEIAYTTFIHHQKRRDHESVGFIIYYCSLLRAPYAVWTIIKQMSDGRRLQPEWSIVDVPIAALYVLEHKPDRYEVAVTEELQLGVITDKDL